jgi:hypothetical protein
MRALGLLFVAACSHSHAKSMVDAVDTDAPPVDAPPGMCTSLAVHDTFDSGPPCQTWGYAFIDDAGGMVMVRNGELNIAPGINAGAGLSHIGCATTAAVDFSAGAFVQVTTPPTMDEYMEFYAGTVVVAWRPTMIKVSHNDFGTTTLLGMVPFDAATTSLVRVRPSDDQMSVVVETSGLDFHWTLAATDPVAPPATASIEVDGGTNSPDPAPAPIVFQGLNVCP